MKTLTLTIDLERLHGRTLSTIPVPKEEMSKHPWDMTSGLLRPRDPSDPQGTWVIEVTNGTTFARVPVPVTVNWFGTPGGLEAFLRDFSHSPAVVGFLIPIEFLVKAEKASSKELQLTLREGMLGVMTSLTVRRGKGLTDLVHAPKGIMGWQDSTALLVASRVNRTKAGRTTCLVNCSHLAALSGALSQPHVMPAHGVRMTYNEDPNRPMYMHNSADNSEGFIAPMTVR